jgi:chemotaxis protein methyltransferase CheR
MIMSFNNDVYKFFSDLIYKLTGMVYSENDYYRLDSRLSQLMRNFSFENVQDLVELYRNHPNAQNKELLVNVCTNNETYFFRDLKPFKGIVEDLIGEAKNKNRKFNMWSCACSTGQEVYSILMKSQEMYGPQILSLINVDASDISKRALDYAKTGVYTNLEVQRGLEAKYLVKFFSQNQDKNWEMSPELRKKINFFEFNLINGNFPKEKYHFISCRNVLIYQDVEKKKAILENIYSTLAPEGHLLLGAGESMIGLNLPFKQVQINETMFFKK